MKSISTNIYDSLEESKSEFEIERTESSGLNIPRVHTMDQNSDSISTMTSKIQLPNHEKKMKNDD